MVGAYAPLILGVKRQKYFFLKNQATHYNGAPHMLGTELIMFLYSFAVICYYQYYLYSNHHGYI